MFAYRFRSRRMRLAAAALVVPLAFGMVALPARASKPRLADAGNGRQEPAQREGEEGRSRRKDAAMHDGGTVMPPAGWLDYCRRNPSDIGCLAAALTPAHMHELKEVQSAMWRLPRRSDEQLYHQAEYWVPATSAGGDCEDIALAARAQLLALGWPSTALRLATAWTERGEHHLVLTVDVVRDGQVATLVLDSRFPTVQSWQALRKFGYRFESRQASRGATWVAVVDEETPAFRSRDHGLTVASNDADVATAAASAATSVPPAPPSD